jgi:predicted RNA-binding Zn-ribbon protein involved in translation (DUF1610 family)
VEFPLDCSKFEELYNDLAKRKSYCAHKNAVSIDANNVVHFNCPACGLSGYASIKTAEYLGWLNQLELDKRG